MSNVIDFPTDPISDAPPAEDPEAQGGAKLDILDTPVYGAFKTGAPAQHDSRLRLLTPREFCEYYSKRDWLIHGVMERAALGEIFGPSQSLKSFLAIDMGLCIAAGIPWHGHMVRKGAVVYICGEGRAGLSRRLRAWEQHHGQPIDDLPFLITSRPALLCEREMIGTVAQGLYNATLGTENMPELIIVDTLARCFGGDENSTQDMNEFVQNLDSYFRTIFGCTVLLIHHVGHRSQDRSRGSSALHAALDFELRTIRSKDYLRVDTTKSKEDEAAPSWYFKMERVQLQDGTQEATTSVVLVPVDRTVAKSAMAVLGRQQIRFLQLLERFGPGGVMVSLAAFKKLCKEEEMAPKTVRDCCMKMPEKGLITCSLEGDSIAISAAGTALLLQQQQVND